MSTTSPADPRPSVSVLMFVEDPGAANYLAELPAALAARGLSTVVTAEGAGRSFLLDRGIPVSEPLSNRTAEALLAARTPSLVVVGTSENIETLGFDLVHAARQAGIPTLGAVDGYSNAAYRFRGATRQPLAHAPDWLAVPDDATQGAFVSLGFPAARAVVCGHPQYDALLAGMAALEALSRTERRRRAFPDALDDRPIVVFAAEVSTGLNPEQYRRSSDYTLTGWGASQERTPIVLEELLDAVSTFEPRPYLVLRLHPKNTREEFAPYLSSFDAVSAGGSPLDVVGAADLVVGMTSMLLVEAALLGRPVLSIVPREAERQWVTATIAGSLPCVTTRPQIHAALRPHLQAPRVQLEPVAPAASSRETALSRLANLVERLVAAPPIRGESTT